MLSCVNKNVARLRKIRIQQTYEINQLMIELRRLGLEPEVFYEKLPNFPNETAPRGVRWTDEDGVHDHRVSSALWV